MCVRGGGGGGANILVRDMSPNKIIKFHEAIPNSYSVRHAHECL